MIHKSVVIMKMNDESMATHEGQLTEMNQSRGRAG